MNIVILSAETNREAFEAAGFMGGRLPLRIEGQPLIEKVVEQWHLVGKVTLVVSAPDWYGLDRKIVHALEAQAGVVVLPAPTRGATISALLALGDLDLEEPVIVVPGDTLFEGEDVRGFCEWLISSRGDMSIMTFEDKRDKRWSYATVTQDERVLEVREKISSRGIPCTGVFAYRSTELFVKSATWVLANEVATQGTYYLSGTINYGVMQGLTCTAYLIRRRPKKVANPRDLFHEYTSQDSG